MQRPAILVILCALVVAAAILPASAQQPDADPRVLGAFAAPFSEPTIDGTPSEEKCLPEDEFGHEECKPAAGTLVMLPDDEFLYHNALENTEDVDISIVAEFGAASVNDQTRVLDLSGDAPAWRAPAPVDGGANPDGNDSEPIVPGGLPISDIGINPYNDGALSAPT